LYRYGTTDRTKKIPLRDRFDGLLVKQDNGCIEWNYSVDNNGYGRVYYKGKVIRGHRFAWQKEHGDIPNAMCILHKCDNPRCVNIDHLFMGTMKDNTQDMLSKHREYRVYGEATTSAKLKNNDIFYIRGSDKTSKDLAKELGVTPNTITKIKRRDIWKHL